MTDNHPPLDLDGALARIVARCAETFTNFKTVVAEDETRQKLELPAILIQLSELEPDLENDPHTGQFPCLVHIDARIVMGHRTPRVRREVAKAAGALAAFAHKNRFGTAWGEARILSVEPDDFAPHADQYDIWHIEWVHAAQLGPHYIERAEGLPAQVLMSWAPDVGPDHENSYHEEIADV